MEIIKRKSDLVINYYIPYKCKFHGIWNSYKKDYNQYYKLIGYIYQDKRKGFTIVETDHLNI